MPGRAHACVAIECGNGLYVFDLGEPAGRGLLAGGLPLPKLRAAFVSHMHSDHVGGLFQFVKNLHLYHNHPGYLPQVDEITLALPGEAVGAVMKFFIASYMFPERLKVKINWLGVRPGPVYEDGNIRVAALPTTHLDEIKPFLAEHPEYAGPRGEAFSFEVTAGGKRVLYSGDLGAISDVLEPARGADVLILEFGHLLPLEDNLRKLAGLGVGKVVLTHIFPDYNEKGAELQSIADRVLPGRVTVAKDGLELVV